jgi:hypothetical protein
LTSNRERGNWCFDTRQRAVMNFICQLCQTGLPYDIFGFVDTLHTGIADRATVTNSPAFRELPSTGKVYPGGAGVYTGFNLLPSTTISPTRRSVCHRT